MSRLRVWFKEIKKEGDWTLMKLKYHSYYSKHDKIVLNHNCTEDQLLPTLSDKDGNHHCRYCKLQAPEKQVKELKVLEIMSRL